jgi:hypothetical protein
MTPQQALRNIEHKCDRYYHDIDEELDCLWAVVLGTGSENAEA